MSMLKVRRSAPINYEITVPGDKSISHRALLLAALSNGTCKITNFLQAEDCLATAEALRELGVQMEFFSDANLVIVEGCHGKFKPPATDINCGNSGTTMRLLAGILAAQPFRSRLVGDASLSHRPMQRIIQPLSLMGARLSTENELGCPPLVIEGAPLKPITYSMPIASAQVKSAILFAGLFTRGKTTVIEPGRSRDHTERMLQHFLIPVQREGRQISLHGPRIPESRDFQVPGDLSSAAFWLIAVAAQPGSRLLIKNVGLNPSRTGIIDILVRMGAHIREVVEQTEGGEPSGTLDIKGTRLRATTIEGDEISNVIDELPILAVAGALAEGKTIIRNAEELRVKETDRITAIVTNLREMGVEVVERDDGMEIQGKLPLQGARLKSFGDHRIAMAFGIAGLFARGETVIEDTDCIRTSYPEYENTLRKIQKRGGLLNRRTPVIGMLNFRQRGNRA
ncbi:MAG: 3-phosphoshikimate 1-carboxyvinyltransferase [Verrucomicrobia bacterium]|nr:MAG: 3-phosphoshikimate 1-carboxyvinyltransferase [Verrucomicrobiota bacterium]